MLGIEEVFRQFIIVKKDEERVLEGLRNGGKPSPQKA